MYLCNILFEMISILSFVKLQNAENEKEPEMQIGTPTDVKHVAHIGWDGGSPNQNSPSWVFTHYFFSSIFSINFGITTYSIIIKYI